MLETSVCGAEKGAVVACLDAAGLGADIPAFLRVLLSTDGTVTKSLEAFYWEPIEVVSAGQRLQPLAADEPLLQKRRGEEILERRVHLVGMRSGTLYANACSIIASQALPTEVREGLSAGRLGIGELLRDSGFETFREIIDYGHSKPAGHVWRRYLIRMRSQPLILIREEFPLASYRAGAAENL